MNKYVEEIREKYKGQDDDFIKEIKENIKDIKFELVENLDIEEDIIYLAFNYSKETLEHKKSFEIMKKSMFDAFKRFFIQNNFKQVELIDLYYDLNMKNAFDKKVELDEEVLVMWLIFKAKGEK